MLGRAQPIYL
jgi:hypothetical protein